MGIMSADNPEIRQTERSARELIDATETFLERCKKIDLSDDKLQLREGQVTVPITSPALPEMSHVHISSMGNDEHTLYEYILFSYPRLVSENNVSYRVSYHITIDPTTSVSGFSSIALANEDGWQQVDRSSIEIDDDDLEYLGEIIRSHQLYSAN